MRRLWLRGLFYTLMGALSVVSMAAAGVAFTNAWVQWSATSYLHDALEDMPARDVAIVPGTGAKGEIGGYFLPRMLAALDLYRAHKVRAILVSGIGGSEDDGNEVTLAGRWLRERGVPSADIMFDHAGFRTLDTMQRARQAFHVSSAIVCSQSYFLNRAVFLAHAAGIEAEGFLTLAPSRRDTFAMRLETAKRTLAFVDTYVLHRGPRVPASDPLLAVDQ
jgi:SanA protein